MSACTCLRARRGVCALRTSLSGGLPSATSMSVMPSAQMSTAAEKLPSSIISGAIHSGEPITVPLLVPSAEVRARATLRAATRVGVGDASGRGVARNAPSPLPKRGKDSAQTHAAALPSDAATETLRCATDRGLVLPCAHTTAASPRVSSASSAHGPPSARACALRECVGASVLRAAVCGRALSSLVAMPKSASLTAPFSVSCGSGRIPGAA
eukprot:4740126-Pleurochrysis_carterae.AAC.1